MVEKKLSSKRLYERDWMKIDVDQVECVNNVVTTKEIIRHPGAAVILAVHNGRIIMEKQYRYAIGKFVYELPAGKLDENETPLDGAIREFEEECGYHALNMHSLGYFYPAFSYSDEILHMFYTTEFEKTAQHFDEDESIELVEFTLEEIEKMIETNEIFDAKTICTIHKYQQVINK